MCAAFHKVIIDVVAGRVVLRNSQLALLIFLKECCVTLCLACVGSRKLSAAADAAVRASHDFDEIELLFALFDLLDESICIAEAVYYADTDLEIACGNFEDLCAFEAADTALCDGLQGVRRGISKDVTDDCFGNTAGVAKDGAGTGCLAERIVRLGIREISKVDTGFFNHADEFLRGEDEIDQALAVFFKLGACCFELLGGAGHNGDRVDFFILELLADDGAHHCHRAAAGRDLRHELGMSMLNMLDPAGAAGSEHRELCTGLNLVEELIGFLKNGKVSSEVGVIHDICAETLESSDELAGYGLGCGHTKCLSNADTHGRSKLDDGLLVAVAEEAPALFGFILNGDGTGGADCCALAAANAGGLAHGLAKAGSNICLFAALSKVNGTDVLNFCAHTDTETAEDALGRITDDALGRIINGETAVGVFAGDLGGCKSGKLRDGVYEDRK